MRCDQCKFWRQDFTESDPSKQSLGGECRRHSPQPSYDPGPFYDLDDQTFTYFPSWPITDDDDWCGEWQPKTPDLTIATLDPYRPLVLTLMPGLTGYAQETADKPDPMTALGQAAGTELNQKIVEAWTK